MRNESKTRHRQETYRHTYGADATQAAFLLGGIGTGNFSIGSRGEMRSWEIFGNPGKNLTLPFTFAALWVKPKGGNAVCRVIESEIKPPYAAALGLSSSTVSGLPRLAASTMRGEYPFVTVDFQDREVPVTVGLEAFTPFIPLNADDSGIPAAIVRYRVKNTARTAVDATVVFSMANMVGIIPKVNTWGGIDVEKSTRNEYRRGNKDVHGIFCTAPELPATHPTYGTMACAVCGPGVTHKAEWLAGGWSDGIHDLWDDLCKDGRLEARSTYGNLETSGNWAVKTRIGSIGRRFSLRPGEETCVQFIVAWHFPNRFKRWETDPCCNDPSAEMTRNYYAVKFDDAWDVIGYVAANLSRLEKASRDFHRALFTSTLPPYVIEALADNITVLRSPTCFRLEDGTFCGWEGSFDSGGSCHGSCMHVWNYAQTVAFLFPELEMTMRRVEFGLETAESGEMAFRTERVFGRKRWEHLPAVDGQYGTIVRMYRDWKISGDSARLKELWPNIRLAINFGFAYWDADKDFVLDSRQHNTYDIEFYGPNSMANSMFYAALKAGVEMATFMRDDASEVQWKTALATGSARMDRLLWGGEYYVQKSDALGKHRYQYGNGCLADQLIGQFLAHVAGLGHILPRTHVRKAVASIFRYNFKSPMRTHHNVQRTYALADEAGLVLCSWPHGGRPRFPFVYADEVWTGVEYQVAAHLIFEGMVEEGLTVVKAVRDRHEGIRRSPWNEAECGHHYARSMSSWALLIALSGFKVDMVKNIMSFAPVINQDNFSSFFSNGRGWGIYRQRRDRKTGKIVRAIETLYGDLSGVSLQTARDDVR